MATAYLDRSKLAALVGAKTLEKAEQQAQANVDAVIAACCATADGYVRKQVQLPPTPEAIEQVAPIVAELVLTTLYANSNNPEMTRRADTALKKLRDIASGESVLHSIPPVDDPATPEDESATGAACGVAPRQMTWGLRSSDGFDTF